MNKKLTNKIGKIKMLDIKKLNELKEIINLRALCKYSGLKYSTIYQRLRRQVVLRPLESHKLTNGLKKFGIKILQDNQN